MPRLKSQLLFYYPQDGMNAHCFWFIVICALIAGSTTQEGDLFSGFLSFELVHLIYASLEKEHLIDSFYSVSLAHDNRLDCH